MDVDKLEAEAKKTGETHVTNMFQRPDQLEKVEQYMRKRSRNKASVEAMLKTAMQSQLDGVRVGLNQVQIAQQDIHGIKGSLVALEKLFSSVPKLYEKLQDVRDENMRHSQYVTAMENLKHIFTVPESVEKTKLWIQEGKLLLSFQRGIEGALYAPPLLEQRVVDEWQKTYLKSLTDLENSRDDLLYELHKLPNQAPADKSMLKAYFEDVEELSQLLEKQLRLVLSRTLNTVRKEPTVIVTALRIIEREEKADTFVLQRYRESGFLPPGRPKKWRQMAMEVLEKEVAQRIEGTHVDEKTANKMWLVRYLELTRQLILEDLRVVKTLCVPCFPPSYDIANKFVSMYHSCLSYHLQEIIQSGLQGNEIVSLLSWIMNTYTGVELMQNPELNIDTSSIGPLLEQRVVDELQKTYLKTMESNYTEWMQKTLETEKEEWQRGEAPQGDDQDGHFHTVSPVIVFQMIDQNLQVTQTISPELTFKALVLGMEQVTKYGLMYREAVIAFKCRHFEDRSQVPYFTHYVITIVNNCLQFMELAQHTKQRYWKTGHHDNSASQKFEALLGTFQNLRDEVVHFLLEEAFLDLEPHFQNLITQKWMTSSHPVDTICVTLEDYFQDYVHLRARNFDYVISEAQNLAAKKYITAMLQKKVTFKSYEDRRDAGLKIIKEADQIKGLFIRVAPKAANFDSPFDIIRNLAEVLKSEDPEILSLDLHGIADKYPDVTPEQLTQLLSLRGDISRSDAREKVSFIFNANKNKQREIRTIFSLI